MRFEVKYKPYAHVKVEGKGLIKALTGNTFFSRKHFFVFYRNFGFNLEISSYYYSQLKKHLKVDPETRSYDFLTKTLEKYRRSKNCTGPLKPFSW